MRSSLVNIEEPEKLVHRDIRRPFAAQLRQLKNSEEHLRETLLDGER